MAKLTLHATVRMAWWWQWYKVGVLTACAITGQQPNDDRVRYWAKHAMRITFTNEVTRDE